MKSWMNKNDESKAKQAKGNSSRRGENRQLRADWSSQILEDILTANWRTGMKKQRACIQSQKKQRGEAGVKVNSFLLFWFSLLVWTIVFISLVLTVHAALFSVGVSKEQNKGTCPARSDSDEDRNAKQEIESPWLVRTNRSSIVGL